MRKEDFLYRWVGLILKLGSYCSLVLIILGLILSFFTGKTFSLSEKNLPLSIGQFFSSFKNFYSVVILNLGLLILMFTPFFRVLTALLSFLFSKDIKYTLISSGVFLILVFSLILALR